MDKNKRSYFVGANNIVKKLLDFLGCFDWISPTATLVEDFLEGGLFSLNVWTFFVPFNEAMSSGWAPFQIRDLLARHGVKSWGDLVTGGELSFNVKLEQAQWAEYVLCRYGVPVAQRSLGAPQPKQKTKHSSKKKEQKSAKDPLSFLDNLLDKYP